MRFLLQEPHLDQWLQTVTSSLPGAKLGDIPELKLHIGSYEGDMAAYLDLNGKSVTNTQILVAGSTGSGKSNLLSVLIEELRQRSVDTDFPVAFLLFDYKGEFSDPANSNWLDAFGVDRSVLFNPIEAPLPITPFKDFTDRPQNEINLYSTELASAFNALDRTSISANMSNRLSEAVIAAYRQTKNKPITFDRILQAYTDSQPDKDKDKTDSVKSILSQLIRNKLFLDADQYDIINKPMIVNLARFPKDGPLAKAIVYFLISKLRNIYDDLPMQAVSDKYVQLRHFTVIDEAHYMLDFENQPLKHLIAVGRNKGLSIILATQNMDSFKSEHFDFYANAQYPLLMKQQSINDQVLKDIFGVSGKEHQELREMVNGLEKGELLIKNKQSSALGIGKKYKKIKVRLLGES